MPFIPSDIYDKVTTLNCEDVAKRLGLDVRNHKCRCFIHDDTHPSLSFFGKDRSAWNCFVCRKGGSAVQLVMNYYGVNLYDACKWLCREFNIHFSGNSQQPTKAYKPKTYFIKPINKSVEEERPFDSEIAQYILDNCNLTEEACNFLFEKRKLKSEVIKDLGIVALSHTNDMLLLLMQTFPIDRLLDSGFVKITNGTPYLRLWTPCLLFPYHNMDGQLIGIQSRYLGTVKEAPRFLFFSKNKTHLFNLPILNKIKYGESLYISEGITDCLALLSSGRNAIAIPSATILPKDELTLLRRYKLHMFPDNDDAGKAAFSNIQTHLIQYGGFVFREKLPEGVKDFSDYYLHSVSLNDHLTK